MIERARMNSQGRIVLPHACRAKAGFVAGAEVLVECVGEGELLLLTKRRAIERAQEIVARGVPKDRDLVAELIAERREQAAHE